MVAAHSNLNDAGQIPGSARRIFFIDVAGIGSTVKCIPVGAVAGQDPTRHLFGAGVSGAKLTVTIIAPCINVTSSRQGQCVIAILCTVGSCDIHNRIVVTGGNIAQQTVAVYTHDLHGCIVHSRIAGRFFCHVGSQSNGIFLRFAGVISIESHRQFLCQILVG